MMRGSILVIEDNEDIREAVRILLENESYAITEAENGAEGLKLLTGDTDLVILDIMMPGMSGLRTCEEIRKVSNMPVLFLTAKARESDKLAGLIAGGDDYMTKPFSYAELLGRVRALIRRYHQYRGKESMKEQEDPEYLETGELRIHRKYNEVWVRGQQGDLTEIEYRILLLMMKNPKKIFSAQNLYESIWNEPYFYHCSSTVMIHIRRLRVKIEEWPEDDIDEQAEKMFFRLVMQIAERESVTEQLKADKQFEWVQQIKTFGFGAKSKLQRNPNFYS